ncbi:hypothetical protein LCL87_05000 [Rhodococcus hoagii]|nr:hypothetical protein [Prescottella equi]
MAWTPDLIVGTDASILHDKGAAGWAFASSDGVVYRRQITDAHDKILDNGVLEHIAVIEALKVYSQMSALILTDHQSIRHGLMYAKRGTHFWRSNNDQIKWIAEDLVGQLDRNDQAGHHSKVRWIKGHKANWADQLEFCLNTVADKVAKGTAGFGYYRGSVEEEVRHFFGKCEVLRDLTPSVITLEPISAYDLLESYELIVDFDHA